MRLPRCARNDGKKCEKFEGVKRMKGNQVIRKPGSGYQGNRISGKEILHIVQNDNEIAAAIFNRLAMTNPVMRGCRI
ncbi:MAG: hypothetical protein JW806_01735 [Sedimentisphaerales bacterium]|nr:hypothetical protein [Sedimentisphaerales bacterium]